MIEQVEEVARGRVLAPRRGRDQLGKGARQGPEGAGQRQHADGQLRCGGAALREVEALDLAGWEGAAERAAIAHSTAQSLEQTSRLQHLETLRRPREQVAQRTSAAPDLVAI